MTRKCCNCDKVNSGEAWVDQKAPLNERFSYTYCPVCLRSYHRQTWRDRRAARRGAMLAHQLA